MDSRNRENIISFPGTPLEIGALQFRIELVLMPTPVWRRILVPGNYSFWDLHVAIQDAMGWRDKHLHQFTMDDPRTRQRMRFGIPDESGFHGAGEVVSGWEYGVKLYFAPEAPPALYTYDFGDDWQHEVVLEEVLSPFDIAPLPTCLAGEGLCPTEDCGGPAAWKDLVSGQATSEFRADEVVFDNPRDRWHRSFAND